MPIVTRPSWLTDFERDGYCVVPSVIPKQACEDFCASAWDWLESFPYGFDRKNRSTWTAEHLPYGFTGGLYNRYAVHHEEFMWKIRVLPELRNAFAQIWGTEDLIVSFDGMNATLPINPKTGRTDLQPTPAWPHIDQNPRDLGSLKLCQGIANLSPNGPLDGGLVLMRGSHILHQDYFESIGGFDKSADIGEVFEGYQFKMGELDWYKERGCEIVKVCADAGDLILWDSRTMHWNASPTASQTRFVQYVAYSPRSLMSESDLSTKLQIFKDRKGTTGWAHKNVVPTDMTENPNHLPRRPDGSVDPANRTRPLTEPEETEAVMWAVGVRP